MKINSNDFFIVKVTKAQQRALVLKRFNVLLIPPPPKKPTIKKQNQKPTHPLNGFNYPLKKKNCHSYCDLNKENIQIMQSGDFCTFFSIHYRLNLNKVNITICFDPVDQIISEHIHCSGLQFNSFSKFKKQNTPNLTETRNNTHS